MRTRSPLFLTCFAAIIVASPIALAGQRRGNAGPARSGGARGAAVARSAPRVAPNFRGAQPRSFQRFNGNWNSSANFARSNATWNQTRANGFRSNAGFNQSAWNQTRVNTLRSNAGFNQSAAAWNRARTNSNWNRTGNNINRSTTNFNGRNGGFVNRNRWNGNWNGNWRHHNHHHHNDFIFIGSFGFPWYYPYYPYYGYYPSSYYSDYYPYDYGYGAGAYGYNPYMSYNYPSYQTYPDDGSSYDNGGQYYEDQSGRHGSDRGGGSDHALVADVQRRLAHDGYYKGAIDGVTGSRTYYAIRAYQRDHNLHADGQISDELLAEMGLR